MDKVTAKTAQDYGKRADALIKQANEDTKTFVFDPLKVAQWLVLRRAELSKATWRQYRAALVFKFTGIQQATPEWTEELTKAILLLKQTLPPEGRPAEAKTSAQKQKKICEADIYKLSIYLDDKNSKYGLNTLFWLMAGMLTGLRPCEWENAEIQQGTKILRVINAKATQGRSHGEDRLINLENLEEVYYQIILLHLANTNKAKLNPKNKGKSGFSQFYEGSRACLYAATRALWPRRKKFITLYSGRHQFAADAKYSMLSKDIIAALMGHASNETAGSHYGRRTAGRSGFNVSASDQDVARVIKLNQNRAERQQSSCGPS